jgi:hypothetical protein
VDSVRRARYNVLERRILGSVTRYVQEATRGPPGSNRRTGGRLSLPILGSFPIKPRSRNTVLLELQIISHKPAVEYTS